jgi:hypothetical protein
MHHGPIAGTSANQHYRICWQFLEQLQNLTGHHPRQAGNYPVLGNTFIKGMGTVTFTKNGTTA